MNHGKYIFWVVFIIALLVLLGCSTTVPVTAKFPQVPERLLEKCPQLEKLENEAKLSDVAKSVVNNYSKYHYCSIQNDAWVDWYNLQKQVFESVK